MRYIISSTVTSLALTLPALAEVPKVVTDIPPVHSLVAQVMGDLGQPELLLEPGASEHDFQLRPSQAAGLQDADLVIWIGPELTPWLDRALSGLEGSGMQLALLQAEGTRTQPFAEGGAHGGDDAHGHEDGEEGHDDHGHDDHAQDEQGHDDHGADEGEGHGHSHEGLDPHAWLDPGNAKVWLGLIAQELGRIDPDNAAAYAGNATAAQARIDALEGELRATLAPAAGKPVVFYHDAYGYFADHYGLTAIGSIALGDATAPGAARMAGLRDGAEQGAIACVFPEAQHDADLAEQLAEGTGAKLGPALDPNGSSLEAGPDLYGTLLTALAGSIAGCAAD